MSLIKYSMIIGLALLMSSCLKNDLEELDSRLSGIEEDLGATTPMTITFDTQYTDGTPISANKTYRFKSTPRSTHYIWPELDGTYDVYIERFSDVEWSEGAWIRFDYDPNTGSISNERARVYFYNEYWDYMGATFDPDFDGLSFSITLNSIDLETGLIDVSAEGSSTAESTNNEYNGKAMNATWEFKGELGVFKRE